MKYHYEKPNTWTAKHASVARCNHGLFQYYTLYKKEDKGLAVVQMRWNPDMKIFWWGPIDPWLIDDIYSAPGFDAYFAANAKDEPYPVIAVRKLMWKLRMKPLPKEPWEQELQVLY